MPGTPPADQVSRPAWRPTPDRPRTIRWQGIAPGRALVLGFLGTIVSGAMLLWMPMSGASPNTTTFVDALFTAASAVCVTGLIVVDTPQHFSFVGQLVILILIQIGGLGYMTTTSFISLLLRQHITLRDRLALQEGLNQLTLEGLVRYVRRVIAVTLAVEGVGAVLLAAWWLREFPLPTALMFGVFHAVSAFNNAGFSLFSDSLVRYVADPVVSLTVAGLFVLGGIGYSVISEALDRLRGVRRRLPWSLHAKLVTTVTTLLLLGGMVAILAGEGGHQGTMADLSPGAKILATLFQSATARTAGFNTLAIGNLSQASLFALILLMFIGASPGSTGGGVKTTTFGILALTTWGALLGRPEVRLFRRRLAAESVSKAFGVTLLSFLLVNGVALLLLHREGHGLVPTLFEVTSAFGTVGLSVGLPDSPTSLSGSFSPMGKLLIVLTMFLGRVGPVTVGAALLVRRRMVRYEYPEEPVLVG
jgi:trk system potassium uptake protein TrkH